MGISSLRVLKGGREEFDCRQWKVILRKGVTGKTNITGRVESEWEERKWKWKRGRAVPV